MQQWDHCMIVHFHAEQIDKMNAVMLYLEFVRDNQTRLHVSVDFDLRWLVF